MASGALERERRLISRYKPFVVDLTDARYQRSRASELLAPLRSRLTLSAKCALLESY